MIVVTGPQHTDEEVGHLAEMAGLLGALPSYAALDQWPLATEVYCLAGWEKCPRAVADVSIAEAFGLAVRPLTA